MILANSIYLLLNLLFLLSILIIFIIADVEVAFGSYCDRIKLWTSLLFYLKAYKVIDCKTRSFFKLIFDYCIFLRIISCFVFYFSNIITNKNSYLSCSYLSTIYQIYIYKYYISTSINWQYITYLSSKSKWLYYNLILLIIWEK